MGVARTGAVTTEVVTIEVAKTGAVTTEMVEAESEIIPGSFAFEAVEHLLCLRGLE